MDLKPKILIVDDELLIRKSLSDILILKGYNTISTCNGLAAIDIVRNENPSVVLLDLKLGDMSGLEVLKTIKEIRPETECILLTGYASQDSAIEAINFGVYGYMQKPYDMEQLLLMIKRAVEKRNAEASLKESEERYRTLFNSSADLIFIQELTGKIIEVNSVACEKLGYSGEECLDMIDVDGKFPDFPLAYNVSELAEKGQKTFECEINNISLEIKAKIINYRGREVVLSIGRDITERKEAEREKEKMQTALTQIHKMESLGILAGGIAHDFNNILGGIMGYSELAMCDMSEEDPSRPLIEHILKASNRAKELVRQILTFSRKNKGERRNIRLEHVIKEVLAFMRASLPANIFIKENINSSYSIKADPDQMYQIILNLCGNAGHAMKEKGGLIEVNLSDTELTREDIRFYPELQPGFYVKLSVKDTGYGIEKEIIDRIFEPFFTTKKREEGTGMGLSVVHGIVKGHGGVITVYSEPGKGTVFNILFPVTHNDEILEDKISEPLPSSDMRVLFVDDEKDMVRLMDGVLRRLGCSPTLATSGMEGLDIFTNNPNKFDLVITDQSMPDITGLVMAEKIMALRPDIPIILCTGFMDAPLPGKCEKAGIKEILEKPVSMRLLGETIKKVIHNK